MKSVRIALAAACLVAFSVSAKANDDSSTFITAYSVYMLGLPIAKSSMKTTISEGQFTTSGLLRSTGIAQVFNDTVAHSDIRGRMTNNGAESTNYNLRYVSGKKKRSTTLVFRNGSVVETRITPKPKVRKAYVPVKPEHLKSVSDPMTAAIIRASSPANVCSRTLRVFDGQMRMNIRLSSPRVGKLSTPGYKGPGVTCNARFQPVAGYRKGRKAIEFLRKASNISVSFAERGSTGIYAPVKAVVPTYIGQLTITATRFGPVE